VVYGSSTCGCLCCWDGVCRGLVWNESRRFWRAVVAESERPVVEEGLGIRGGVSLPAW